MKNTLLILLALGWLSINSIAVAQQPATMTKGNDTLCNDTRLSVEIISVSGNNLDHPTHPATGIACPFFDAFTTSQTYSWYSWESSFFEHENSNTVVADVYYSGYIKVTVGNQNGNIGSDSIWFNIQKDEVEPLRDFIMEIDDELHANFYGIATENHHRLILMRCYVPLQYNYGKDFYLSPGEQWAYTDTNVSYSEDSLWVYGIRTLNTCGNETSYFVVPGLLLNIYNEDEKWYLSMKSSLQSDFSFGSSYLYSIHTIDEYGNRHEFTDHNGNPVTLPDWTTAWQIPGPHIDPYYQVGVVRIREDSSYELLSLSNKVSNPWPDTDGINDENDETSFSVYPNPSHGLVTVVGKGTLSVVNMLGQIVLRQEIDGESTVELPRGIYFVKLGGAVRKVVVE